MSNLGFEFTVDVRQINLGRVRKELDIACKRMLIDTAKKGVSLLKPSVATWTNKPLFRWWGPTVKGNVYEVKFGPEPGTVGFDHWVWVEYGVDPRWIFPVRAPRLRFKSFFRPKTTPGSLVSEQGARSGRWRSPKVVDWPGIEPRGFIDTALAELMPQWGLGISQLAEEFGRAILPEGATLERVVEVHT